MLVLAEFLSVLQWGILIPADVCVEPSAIAKFDFEVSEALK